MSIINSLIPLITIACLITILCSIMFMVTREHFDDTTTVENVDDVCKDVIASSPCLSQARAREIGISTEAYEIISKMQPGFKSNKCKKVGCIIPPLVLTSLDYKNCKEISDSAVQVRKPDYNAEGCFIKFNQENREEGADESFKKIIDNMYKSYDEVVFGEVREKRAKVAKLKEDIKSFNSSNVALTEQLNKCNNTFRSKEQSISSLKAQASIIEDEYKQSVNETSMVNQDNGVTGMLSLTIHASAVTRLHTVHNERLWQRRFHDISNTNEYYTLAYKYASKFKAEINGGVNNIDPYDLWLDVGDARSKTSDLVDLSDLYSNEKHYRNQKVMDYAFSTNEPCEIIVEVCNSSMPHPQRLGYLMFERSSGNILSWFSPNNCVRSSLDITPYKNTKDLVSFDIKGIEGHGRRWFICKRYGGCHNDLASLCIPTYTNICDWDRGVENRYLYHIIMSNHFALNSDARTPAPPINFNETTKNNSKFYGDVMYVWVKRKNNDSFNASARR